MIPENMKPVEVNQQVYDKNLALEVGDVFIVNDYLSRQYGHLAEFLAFLLDPESLATTGKYPLVSFMGGAADQLEHCLGHTDEKSEMLRLETGKFIRKVLNTLVTLVVGTYLHYSEQTTPGNKELPETERTINSLGLYRVVPGNGSNTEKYLSIGYVHSVNYRANSPKPWKAMLLDPIMKTSMIALAIGLTVNEETSVCYSYMKRRLIYTFTSSVLEQITREGAEIQALNVAAQNERMAEAERSRLRNQVVETVMSETPSHGFPIDMIEKPDDGFDMNKTIAGVLEQLMELQKKQMTLLGSLIPTLKK